MKQLITRMKKRKRTAPFPSTLQNFARTLHFYSPAAYEKVRSLLHLLNVYLLLKH